MCCAFCRIVYLSNRCTIYIKYTCFLKCFKKQILLIYTVHLLDKYNKIPALCLQGLNKFKPWKLQTRNVCTDPKLWYNQVITTLVYAASHLHCQIFCGTSQFLTVNHNIITLSYNNNCLLWGKIFGTLHDVIMEFDHIWGLIHKNKIIL